MIRRSMLWFSILTALLFVLAGCAEPNANEVVEANLDEEFILPVGAVVDIAAANLRIEFVEVVSDSRCPSGAKCIWAGEASCLLKITQSGLTYEKVLTQPGLSAPPTDTFAGYEVTFDLLPYPEVGKSIDAKDYQLTLMVSTA